MTITSPINNSLEPWFCPLPYWTLCPFHRIDNTYFMCWHLLKGTNFWKTKKITVDIVTGANKGTKLLHYKWGKRVPSFQCITRHNEARKWFNYLTDTPIILQLAVKTSLCQWILSNIQTFDRQKMQMKYNWANKWFEAQNNYLGMM